MPYDGLGCIPINAFKSTAKKIGLFQRALPPPLANECHDQYREASVLGNWGDTIVETDINSQNNSKSILYLD